MRAIAFVTVAVLAGVSPTLALEGAPLDGGAHPSVGHIFAQQTDPNTCSAEVFTSCSATLVSSTVAVTSGGCADVLLNPQEYGYNFTAIWISFNGDDPFDCGTASRISEMHFHPLFDETMPGSPYDIGVVILSAPAAVTPATLPALGSQGGYARHDPFESVGWAPDSGGNVNTFRRRVAPVLFRSDEPDYLFMRTTLTGPTCATGLDGGAAFQVDSQNLVGLDNGAGRVCKHGVFLRLDTTTARDFLDDYVTLP